MRTQLNTVTQSSFNQKWSVSFTTFKGVPGDEYVASECESAPVFDTEDDAWAGGNRALTLLETEDHFPNMCEKF